MGRVVEPDMMAVIRTQLRAENKTLVFTNGVFDILHRGHVEYLLKARALGDALVVGLNTDASVRRIKGDTRPIIDERDRAFILAHILPVDYVCLFDEDTPLGLISRILPDILVKGADYNVEDIIGREAVELAGGRVATIDFVPDRSTSGIIELILERFS